MSSHPEQWSHQGKERCRYLAKRKLAVLDPGNKRYGGKRTDLVRAVVLIIRLAVLAHQAGPDLCPDTNTVSDLDGRHFVADLDGMANDLVANAKRKACFAPATGDGMDVAAADTTGFDPDVNITLAERLGFELREVSK